MNETNTVPPPHFTRHRFRAPGRRQTHKYPETRQQTYMSDSNGGNPRGLWVTAGLGVRKASWRGVVPGTCRGMANKSQSL